MIDASRSTASDFDVASHLRRVREQGYTVVEDALPRETAAEARAALLALFETDPGVRARLDIGADYMQVENLPNKGRVFEAFFASSPVAAIAAGVLGEDFVAHNIWAFGVPPGAPPDQLHCDEPIPSPTHPIMLVTIYALGDFSAEIGATRVVPGTHLLNEFPPPRLFQDDRAIAIEMPAGSCLLLRGSLWHGAGANVTNDMRVTMAATFSVPWLKPYLDFTRSLHPDVIARATPEVRRIFGYSARPQITEVWQWDTPAGCPKPEHVEPLRARGVGDCCLRGAG